MWSMRMPVVAAAWRGGRGDRALSFATASADDHGHDRDSITVGAPAASVRSSSEHGRPDDDRRPSSTTTAPPRRVGPTTMTTVGATTTAVTATTEAAPGATVPAGAPPRPRRLVAVRRRLAAPVDIASLVAFRTMFGALVVWEVYCYATNGWIHAYWVQPEFHFSYLGFGWVEPLPAAGMWGLFGALSVAGVGIAVGACYRFCTAVFTIGFTYVFLLEPARYLNHFYLFCLLGRCWPLSPPIGAGRSTPPCDPACAPTPRRRGRCGCCAPRSRSSTSTAAWQY
jgi:vitamin K-dependent gamma-carboxylase-like protein